MEKKGKKKGMSKKDRETKGGRKESKEGKRNKDKDEDMTARRC